MLCKQRILKIRDDVDELLMMHDIVYGHIGRVLKSGACGDPKGHIDDRNAPSWQEFGGGFRGLYAQDGIASVSCSVKAEGINRSMGKIENAVAPHGCSHNIPNTPITPSDY